MKFTTQIFNECVPVNVIHGISTDAYFLGTIYPQLQFKHEGFNKKYHVAELQDLKDKDDNQFLDNVYIPFLETCNKYFATVSV